MVYRSTQVCLDAQVDASSASVVASTRGGADVSSSKGDVSSLEPREFFQGSELDSAFLEKPPPSTNGIACISLVLSLLRRAKLDLGNKPGSSCGRLSLRLLCRRSGHADGSPVLCNL